MITMLRTVSISDVICTYCCIMIRAPYSLQVVCNARLLLLSVDGDVASVSLFVISSFDCDAQPFSKLPREGDILSKILLYLSS